MKKNNIDKNSNDNLLPAIFKYHIFPPFVDAYVQSFLDEKQSTLEQIKEMMEGHAVEWGSEVIGKCVLKGKEMPMHDGKIVLCCAYTYTGDNNDPHKDYLILTKGGQEDWYHNLEFVEGKILNEWDVT